MYKILDSTQRNKVYSALASRTREFRQRLSFGEWRVSELRRTFVAEKIYEKGIIKLDISQQGNSDGSGLVLGCCCSSSCTAEFYNIDKTYNYHEKIMFVECGIKLSDDSFFYIPCGYYNVENPKTDDDWRTVSITAYDDIDRLKNKWISGLSFPCKASDVLKEIADKHGIKFTWINDVLAILDERIITEAEALTLTSYNEREVCGFVVGLVGANARMNSVGRMCVTRYTDYSADFSPPISANLQWQNGFKKTTESAFTINSITSGIDDAVFTAGTGTGITFANPIITEAEITAIYKKYGGMSFHPCTCEWRGNPCFECCDIVTVTDRNGVAYKVFIANQDIDLTGGLSMIIDCPGGDADISFDTVDERTRAALNKQKTDLQQAIIDATNKINGALGGYYEILDSDSDGNPDGWIIKETADGSSGIIRANKAGIGLSTDGGKTYRTAITYNGINADCITTGKLNAERIDTSTLVVGGNSYEGLDGLLNAVVDTSNSSVTKVDVLYGQNQSTTAPPTSWSTSAPTWQNGYYIWTKTQTTAGGVVTETDPVCITGAKGATGAQGAQGATGVDGQSVSDIEEQYYLSTSSTTQTGGSWSTSQPTWSSNKYIWTRSKITWENPTATTYTTPILAKAINGANEKANTASSNASSALSVANTANGVIANWAYNNDTTVINGAKIYTGTITAKQIASESITADKLAAGAITAEKVNVGWQSGNCATGWTSDDEAYITITSDSAYNYNPKITMSSSYTSGNIDVNGIPFYASAGDVLRFGGRAYKKSSGDNGVYLKYSSKSNGTYNLVANMWNNTSDLSAGSILDIDKTYTVTQAGWYMITVAFNKQASGAYVTNLFCYRDVKGEMIVNGIIKSVDGNTYFDLDNSILATSNARINGGYVQIGSDEYYTKIEDGVLTQHLSTGTSAVGGLVPTGIDEKTFQTLYYEASDGILFSKNDNGFSYIMSLSDEKVDCYKKFYALEHVYLKNEKGLYGVYDGNNRLCSRIDGYGDLILGYNYTDNSTKIYSGSGKDIEFYIGSTFKTNISSISTQLKNLPTVIDAGRKTDCPTNNSWITVSFNKTFADTPKVVCAVEQQYSGTDETYSVCVGEITTTYFQVKLKMLSGDLTYNCAINWIASS